MLAAYVLARHLSVDEFDVCLCHDSATAELYTLSLHDALPICEPRPTADPAPCRRRAAGRGPAEDRGREVDPPSAGGRGRSEEHTSELQSLTNLVCRLLREKKNRQFPSSVREGPVQGTYRPDLY